MPGTRPYSTQLVASLVASEAGSSYVVPSGMVAVIRDITLWAYSGVSTGGVVLIHDGADLGVTGFPAGEAGFWHWEGRVVSQAGDTILCTTPDNPFTAIVSGYLLLA